MADQKPVKSTHDPYNESFQGILQSDDGDEKLSGLRRPVICLAKCAATQKFQISKYISR
ncbi:hypothetical protein HAX54_004887, partial [Datura stramonium]|nr:hypothetical protein [Datura stramonium]